MKAPFISKESYDNNRKVFVENECLEEAKAWVEHLIEAKKNNNKKLFREASYQTIIWLCKGSRIPSLKFRLAQKTARNKKAQGKGLFGECEEGTKITIWIDMHKEKAGSRWFEEYLDTLLHEWIHHYENSLFGMTTEHDPIFYTRLNHLKKQLKTSPVIAKVL